jgi:hypothetical protein
MGVKEHVREEMITKVLQIFSFPFGGRHEVVGAGGEGMAKARIFSNILQIQALTLTLDC